MIYVHVPFCKRFCTYCDVYSEIEREGCFKPYADELCAEIRRRAREISDSPKTLYFGGGTPSVLPLSVLSRILITLDEVGHGGPYREFTMEVNPEDIVERGKNVEWVIDRYTKTVKPMYLQFIAPSKRYADIIVPQGGHNKVAINVLLSGIRKMAKEKEQE